MTLRPDLLEDIDLSIVRFPVFLSPTPGVVEPTFFWRYKGPNQKTKRAFWLSLAQRALFRTLRSTWTPGKPLHSVADRLKLRDHKLVSDDRINALENPETILREPKQKNVDWKLADLMKEASPQFTLRNIGRKEFDVNLDRPIEFIDTPAAHTEAFQSIKEVRKAEWPQPQLIDFFTTEFFADFNTFIEETLYLCPWDEIPSIKGRDASLEGSNWDPAHSRAQITVHLLDRKARGTFFALNQVGKPTEVMLNPAVFKKRRELRILGPTPPQNPDAAQADAASTDAASTPALPPSDIPPDPGPERMG